MHCVLLCMELGPNDNFVNKRKICMHCLAELMAFLLCAVLRVSPTEEFNFVAQFSYVTPSLCFFFGGAQHQRKKSLPCIFL